MSYQILSEKYSELSVDAVVASGDPDINYYVEIYTRRGGLRIDLWKDGFDDKYKPIHQGIETAMADLIIAAKSGILPSNQTPYDDYELVREIVLKTTNTTVFCERFNDSVEVTRAVFHTGHPICHNATVEIIGKKVNIEIFTTVPKDPFSALPTYYLKFTAEGRGDEVRRDGLAMVSCRRTCCFVVTGSQLRFSEDEIAEIFKEELIVALNLEGQSS